MNTFKRLFITVLIMLTMPSFAVWGQVLDLGDGVADMGGTYVQTIASAAQVLAHVTEAELTNWNTDTETDTLGEMTNATFTASVSGFYIISLQIGLASNATGCRQVTIKKNGTTNIQREIFTPVNDEVTEVEMTAIQLLAAGDRVSVTAYQNSGGNLNTYSGRLVVRRIP